MSLRPGPRGQDLLLARTLQSLLLNLSMVEVGANQEDSMVPLQLAVRDVNRGQTLKIMPSGLGLGSTY